MACANVVRKLDCEGALSICHHHRHGRQRHAGYFDLPHVDLQHFPVDQIPIYKNWAYIKIFRHNIVKQPDVLNLMYFYSQDYTLEEKLAKTRC